MADAAWPATLPDAPLRQGWQRRPQPNTISFKPSVGTPKVRRRSTARGDAISLTFRFSGAQLATFWSFYGDDLADGALPFTHTDPVLGGTLRLMFEPEQVPVETPAQAIDRYDVACLLTRLS